MSGSWAWTADGEIYVPEIQHITIPKDCSVVALRGYGYVSAVVTNSGQCIGWTVSKDQE